MSINIMSTEELEYLSRRFREEGIPADEALCARFLQFYQLLTEKNKVMNLTAITDFRDAVEKHFLDSLTLFRDVDASVVSSMIDVGCGAGFPGMPVKFLHPEISVTFVDSVGKKIHFISEAASAMDLTGVRPVPARVEDLARQKDYREMYDLCTSRAVARLATLAEYCLPFVKIGGLFAAYKGGDCEEELKEADHALRTLGGEVEKVDTFDLGEMRRSLILVRKVRKTPARFPRKAGVPGKEPLLAK